MSVINKLEEKFTRFPGIGPRQAKRFVQYLLTSPEGFIDELIVLLQELKKGTGRCNSCMRFFTKKPNSSGSLCSICGEAERDIGLLMVVAKEADIDTIEYSGIYNGLYFVLGDILPVLTKEPQSKIKIKELANVVERRAKEEELKEVILALPANPEGDNTSRYVRDVLSPIAEKYGFKMSLLGRGLSTGLELEYSDSETIRNALSNRG